ncbi:hypothetical protein ON010_g5976 [Phytophthora cinnamomi]|nr:hypothetical protein ON010_g5976 [Phytophthora cinnamomi]
MKLATLAVVAAVAVATVSAADQPDLRVADNKPAEAVLAAGAKTPEGTKKEQCGGGWGWGGGCGWGW